MGLWILKGEMNGSDEGAVIINSVTMRPVPFFFWDSDEAEAFTQWVAKRSCLRALDSFSETECLVERFRRETNTLCDVCEISARQSGFTMCAACLEASERIRAKAERLRDADANHGIALKKRHAEEGF